MSKFETSVKDGKVRLNGILTDLTPEEAKQLAAALTDAAEKVRFVPGGVYRDQDGVIYVGDGVKGYTSQPASVKLWNTARGTHCSPEWWQAGGKVLTPVLTSAGGVPLVINP